MHSTIGKLLGSLIFGWQSLQENTDSEFKPVKNLLRVTSLSCGGFSKCIYIYIYLCIGSSTGG